MLRVEIDQRHFDLATISGIDGAGRVEHGDALLGGKAGARMDQCHISCGQGYRHTGGNQCTLKRFQGHVNGGDQVGAGVARMGVMQPGRVLGGQGF